MNTLGVAPINYTPSVIATNQKEKNYKVYKSLKKRGQHTQVLSC